MNADETQTTAIAPSTSEDVFVHGKSLCKELIGHLSFTEMIFFQILGRVPSPGQRDALDACLVTLMEHGLTPSAIVARLVYSSAPEAMQGAVAAGLSSIGSRFVGTMEECGTILQRLLSAEHGPTIEAQRVAQEYRERRQPVPGFGQLPHHTDDPRALRLLQLAEERLVVGAQVSALRVLGAAVDEAHGSHVPLSATGAVTALLGDCGVPQEILRGFALIARSASLVRHVHEERLAPSLRSLWESAERAVPYVRR